MNPHPTWTRWGLPVCRVELDWSRAPHLGLAGKRRQWYVRLFGRWIKVWEQNG